VVHLSRSAQSERAGGARVVDYQIGQRDVVRWDDVDRNQTDGPLKEMSMVSYDAVESGAVRTPRVQLLRYVVASWDP
jgi:hypothetical protein